MPVRGESFNAQQCFAGEELYMKIRPFRHPYVNACVAGAQADEMDAWTEPELHAFLRDACGHILGNDAAQKLGAFKTSHWRQSNGCAALTPPPFPATVIKERCLCNRWIIVYILSAKRQHRILLIRCTVLIFPDAAPSPTSWRIDGRFKVREISREVIYIRNQIFRLWPHPQMFYEFSNHFFCL